MRDPAAELAELEQNALRRSLRQVSGRRSVMLGVDGRDVVNFSSNDYLGLAAADITAAALKAAIDIWGAGSGASRLVCGNFSPHAELEAALAKAKRTEAALTFSSGYAAAVGALGALLRPGDVVILDKLCHASLVDGARLSGAALRVFPHNQMEKLERLLAWGQESAGSQGRVLVVTESVFSMDGDWAELAEIVRLKEQFGAWLLLDEAHGFGILGAGGRGLADKLGLAAKVDIHLGTLSKAVGLSGGFVASRRGIIDLLINKARSFIFSTAPPPAIAAAAKDVVEKFLPTSIGDRRRLQLWHNVAEFSRLMQGRIGETHSAIVPVIVGEESRALTLSQALLDAGFLVPAIRYPTVARGAARLRLTFSSDHTAEQIGALAARLGELLG
jgi:8-amino-7-oxononanoate synthase